MLRKMMGFQLLINAGIVNFLQSFICGTVM